MTSRIFSWDGFFRFCSSTFSLQLSLFQPPSEKGVLDSPLKEPRAFRTLSVENSTSLKALTPDQTIAKEVLNMKTMKFPGSHQSILLDEARERGLIPTHGGAHSTINNGTKFDIFTRSIPPSLNELITAGRLVEQPDGQCMIKSLDSETKLLSIANAISMGHLDAERSLVRNPATGNWSTLNEALESGQVDCRSGYVDLQPGWISLLDAASRGLLSDDVPTTPRSPLSFQEALIQGHIDPATSIFYKPGSSRSSTPKMMGVQEAIRQGLLEPPTTMVSSSSSDETIFVVHFFTVLVCVFIYFSSFDRVSI